MSRKVILVDRNDRKVGLEDKLKAHKNNGMLHRAVSVYIFNSKMQLMLQRRARNVYHSGMLWSNTCCTNCYGSESAYESAHRSLKNEMGFDCDLKEAFSTIYKTPVSDTMTEHEFLHVFFGIYEKDPKPSRRKVMGWKWMDIEELRRAVRNDGNAYSPWFRIMLKDRRLYDEMSKFFRLVGRLDKQRKVHSIRGHRGLRQKHAGKKVLRKA